MKPRDVIDKRKNTYLIVVAASFAVMTILAFTEKYIPPDIFRPLVRGSIAVFVAGNILMYIGIRCPKCKAILGYVIVFSRKKVDQCPRCRILFDEEIP